MGLLQGAARTIVLADFLFLLLLGFSLLYVRPGTSAYVVAWLTLVPVALSFVAAIAVLYTGWSPFE